MSDNIVAVKILDRSYNIKCAEEEAQDLLTAAEYLNSEIQKLRQQSHSSAKEGVAIVAALNVCHQLMLLKKQQNKTINSMHEKISQLQSKIQNFLAVNEEIAV